MPATAEPANAQVATIMIRTMMDIVCLSLVDERIAAIRFWRLRERSFPDVRGRVNAFCEASLWLID
jgi:hypothetical protein